MGKYTESISTLAALGVFLLGAYSLWRSSGDKRDEKLADEEARSNHIESFLEFKFPDIFKRWRK